MQRTLAVSLVLFLAGVAALGAQSTLERTTNLPGGWIGLPWQVDLLPSYSVLGTSPGGESGPWTGRAGLTAALGLPLRAGAGLHWATPAWPVERPDAATDEVELFLRYPSFGRELGLPVDITGDVAYNLAAASLDTEIGVRAPLGPLDLLGALRGMTSGPGEEARYAVAAGAVYMPRPRSLPVALTADVGTLLDRRAGEHPSWSGGVAIGMPYVGYTVSIFAANSVSSTIQGRSTGSPYTRFGFELTVPIPLARTIGAAVPREEAAEAVDTDPAAAPTVTADIREYRFMPERLVVERGAVIEWVNRDEVVHTVSADDATWDSGAIRPGERWRASFNEPGLYLYHCGPHPYMRAVVEVR